MVFGRSANNEFLTKNITMIQGKILPSLILCCMLSLSLCVTAQDHKKDKEFEYKKEKNEGKHKKEKYRKDKEYKKSGSQDPKVQQRIPKTVGILGKVIFPKVKTAPRQLVNVPKGHYPPSGSCRVWYPNRPPGHQPPPTSCDNLRGVRLEKGAFILHGDKAYDAEYDWKEAEKRNPNTVSRDILDILFPNRR